MMVEPSYATMLEGEPDALATPVEGVLLEPVPRVVEGKMVYRDPPNINMGRGDAQRVRLARDAGSTLTTWRRPELLARTIGAL